MESQPGGWDPSWRHVPARRATEDKPRWPLTPLVSNLPADASPADKRFAKLYWQGACGEWSDWHQTVMSGQDVILFPEASGLVILDCDVRVVPEFSDDGKSCGFTSEKGIEQLSKAVADLGHTMAEVATYAVRTPSGGVHLYFRQNEEVMLRKTSHHRDKWRVDVIVSENLWVAAPPTPGYEVIRQIPVKTMPGWLSEWLGGVNERFKPCGGKRAERLLALSGAQSSVKLPGNGSLLDMWVKSELELVTIASDMGCWNVMIFQATCNLLEYGFDYERVKEAVITAAVPWDDRERRNAERTVESARQTVSRHE